jgi:putative copper export protein
MRGLLFSSALLTAPLVLAATPWQVAHPARAKVLQRANHLDHRIAYARWTGALTPWRAAALQHQVAQVRWRQDVLARRQGGALVRSQYWALNRQEDAISWEITP